MTRRAWALAGAFLVLAGFLVGGLDRVRIDTGIASFLPSDDPVYRALEDKARSFGGDPVIVLLESEKDRELLLNPDQLVELLKLEGELAGLPDVAAVYGPATVLNQTAGAAQDMLAQISGRRDGLQRTTEIAAKKRGATDAEAAAKGKAAVAAFDRRYGALLVQGLPAGLPTLRNPHFVQAVMFDENARPRSQWHFVVPAADTVAVLVRPREDIDQAAAGRLVAAVRKSVHAAGLDTSRTTVTGVPVVTSALTDAARSELPLLGGVSLAAVGAVFLVVSWTRRRRDRLWPTLAAVLGTVTTVAVFGWLDHPLSLGVVAFLPILLGIGSDYPFYLAQGRHRRRVLVAALAATVGFASLAMSPLPFVRELGLALALGIVLTVGIALVRGPVPGDRTGPAAVDPTVPSASSTPPGRRPAGWQRLGIAAAAVAVAAVGWVALPGLAVEAQPEALASGLPELEDAEYAEQVLGSSGEVSVVLRGKDLANPAVLRWAQDAESAVVLEHGDQVHPVVTIGDVFRFLGDRPTQAQIESAIELFPSYLTSSVLRSDRTEAVLVFGVEISDVEELGRVLDEVRATLPPAPDGTTASLVGLPVAAVRGLDLVSSGRLWMNLAGVLAAGLVVAVGLRNRGDVSRAMITVLLSTGWVAALALVTTGSLNPLTVAIGSLTTATGCEFAIMLARSGRASALRDVGTAAFAGTIGYLVLTLSGLAVLRDFGLLLAASVGCSFVAATVACQVLVPVKPPVPVPAQPARATTRNLEVAVP
jgi:hypothetical protein